MDKKTRAAMAGLAFLAGCEIGIAIQLMKMIHKFTVKEMAADTSMEDAAMDDAAMDDAAIDGAVIDGAVIDDASIDDAADALTDEPAGEGAAL